jgi:hypothetical protein
LALCQTASAGSAGAPPAYDIPKLENIAVDGKADDWGEKGFRVNVLTDVTGRVIPAGNYNAAFRLGWDDKGLLILATVTDDVFLEPFKKPEELWKGDSIEFFMCVTRGGEDSFQVVVAPGCDSNEAEVRQNISDYRKSEELKKSKLAISVARTKIEKGFIMEACLPWKNLGIEATEGLEVGFQFYANDSDKEGERFQLLWYPVPEANVDSNRMYSLRLASKSAAAVQLSVVGAYDEEGRGKMTVVGAADLDGKKIKFKDGDRDVGKVKLEADGGRSTGTVKLSKPKDKAYGPLTVFLEDEPVAKYTIPEPAKKEK